MIFFVAFAVCVCVSAVAGQNGVCSEAESQLGTYLKPHETFCGLYYHCDKSRAWLRQCPRGLLFDSTSRRCLSPTEANCQRERCDALTGPRNFDTFCCEIFVSCSGGVKTVSECPLGQMFDQSTQTCVSGTSCVYQFADIGCPRKAPPPGQATPRPVCNSRAVPDNPCKFHVFGPNGFDFGPQSCAEGTSFDPLTCQCSVFNSSCAFARRHVWENKYSDPQCRPSMTLEYPTTNFRPSSYSMKNPQGEKKDNGYYIESVGYSPKGNEAVLGTDSTGAKASLLIYHFAQNMIVGPFGIKITFKAENPQDGYSFSLVTNDMSSMRSDCPGTLDARAIYSAGQWLFSVKTVGTDQNGNRVNAELRQSMTTVSSNSYVTVVIVFDKMTISGYAWDEINVVNPVSLGSRPAGEKIQSNNCGLQLAGGLEGRLRQASFYEACEDVSRLIPDIRA